MDKEYNKDLTDSIFETLFGESWDSMFLDRGSFFGELFEHVNEFAVSLIVIISLVTIIGGLIRAGQKKEFLGQGRTVSFWVIRLVLFVGCCFPAIHGYSIAQGVLLKLVRISADVGNTISVKAFDTMANTGMLPIGSASGVPDKMLMYMVFDNAVCHSYIKKHIDRSSRKHANPTPFLFYGQRIVGAETFFNYEGWNSIDSLTPENRIKLNEQLKILRENLTAVDVRELYGAKWGGLINSETYATDICGKAVLICDRNEINSIALREISIRRLEENEVSKNRFNTETIEFANKYNPLKRKIAAEALTYCNNYGTHLTNYMKKVSELADQLVDSQKPIRGQLEQYQIEFEALIAAEQKTLNTTIQTLIGELIKDSEVKQKVEENGFIMLGFYYYQLSNLIDSARNMVTIKPTISLPDYENIDPNDNEAKGFGSYMLMANSYKNSRISDCAGANTTTTPSCTFNEKAEDFDSGNGDYTYNKLTSYVDGKSLNNILLELNPEAPVSSIINTGDRMINLGSMVIGAYVTADIALYSFDKSAIGWFSEKTSPLYNFFKRLVYWIGIGLITFSIYMLTCGIFLFFVVPTIPLVTWLFAIFSWIIIVFETMVAIPFWAVASSTSSGDGFVADTGRTGITLFLNVIIRPILLPIFLFAAIALAVIFSRLVILGAEIFFSGHITAHASWFTHLFAWAWKFFLITYLFVMSFKLSHEIMAKGYDYVMRFVSSTGRGDYGTDAPNSDMMGKGMAMSAAITGSVGSALKQTKDTQFVKKSADKNPDKDELAIAKDNPPPNDIRPNNGN